MPQCASSVKAVLSALSMLCRRPHTCLDVCVLLCVSWGLVEAHGLLMDAGRSTWLAHKDCKHTGLTSSSTLCIMGWALLACFSLCCDLCRSLSAQCHAKQRHSLAGLHYKSSLAMCKYLQWLRQCKQAASPSTNRQALP